jgi:hypothetical protein
MGKRIAVIWRKAIALILRDDQQLNLTAIIGRIYPIE